MKSNKKVIRFEGTKTVASNVKLNRTKVKLKYLEEMTLSGWLLRTQLGSIKSRVQFLDDLMEDASPCTINPNLTNYGILKVHK